MAFFIQQVILEQKKKSLSLVSSSLTSSSLTSSSLTSSSLTSSSLASSSSVSAKTFKPNLTASDLIKKINTDAHKNYTVKVAYTHLNKIIGIGVQRSNDGKSIYYIPCLPTVDELRQERDGLVQIQPIETYTRLKLTKTKEFLLGLKKIFQDIPCAFARVVEENDSIIGIITEAESFIPVKKTALGNTPGKAAERVNRNEEDHLLADRYIMTATETEESDQNTGIHTVQLETRFYDIFRTTAKYALSLFYKENRTKLHQITAIMASTKSYNLNLQFLIAALQKLLKNVYISFDAVTPDDLQTLFKNPLQVQRCYGSDVVAALDTSLVCTLNPAVNPEEDKAVERRLLKLPKNYEYVYLGRLADELLRNSRIAELLLNRNRYLTTTQFQVDNVPVFSINTNIENHLTSDLVDRNMFVKTTHPYTSSRSTTSRSTSRTLRRQPYSIKSNKSKKQRF
jgi:hypothetical protein